MSNQRNDIIIYFNQIERSDFLENDKGAASLDLPASIGFDQTISQPTLVLSMTIELDPRPDSRVLEIGTGSGYQTALVAAFSKEVYTVERIETLHHQAKERLSKKGFANVYYKLTDGSFGWPEHQPYDRIIVTASVDRVPDELLDQLAAGGRMIIPVGDNRMQQLQRIEKDFDGVMTSSVLEHVAFVRLKGKYE